MRRRGIRSCTTMLALLIIACGGAEVATEPVVTSVAGTWNLTSVNGKSLPFTFQAADPREELLAKKYVITAAGTYSYSYSVRATDDDGQVTLSNGSDSGTESLSNTIVTFRSGSDGSTLTAVVSGTTMTIVSGDYSQLFTKQ
ncbi:MAG: Lipocalin-like domain protein [Gemmatimonadetes bacterium]|nr:Lipocalin-like domain protein [Gemmatimonadota bacterium]